MVNFTDIEKAKLFDEMSSHFYNKNFGTFSKSDIDLLMFHFYEEKITRESNRDGIIDYKKCSDYKMSKELGITQQRVRNLKVRSKLVYPGEERDWKEDFAKLIENARLEDNSKKIVIGIPDPNLYIEIENFLDENGKYIEKQLNSKLLVMRIEYFIDLCISIEDTDDRKRIKNNIAKICKMANRDNKKFDNCNIGQYLMENAVNITTLIGNISPCFSAGNTVFKAFKYLLLSS